ncbi:hypothetical protein V2H32_02535, partial [Streptococcus uberis]|uniref:hypothetical protein n=1 Tax=Streptococcus uberis TaxID=1349 RepID=UPI002EC1AB08|nr:hypothetical protein [Streptococcus uberis]
SPSIDMYIYSYKSKKKLGMLRVFSTDTISCYHIQTKTIKFCSILLEKLDQKYYLFYGERERKQYFD